MITDYYTALAAHPAGQTALIIDEQTFSYGDLLAEIAAARSSLSFPCEPIVHPISDRDVLRQLILFLACSRTTGIPVITPENLDICPTKQSPPADDVCMAVCSSGTTGKPKLLYRSFRSWFDFFPVQNEIFGIGRDKALFIQGSLAFTGNLNLCLSQLCSGGSIITSRYLDPRRWASLMKKHQPDAIYLIPAKLRLFLQKTPGPFHPVHSVIAGSQSLGPADIHKVNNAFPAGTLYLYYGSSELSYVTYTTGSEITRNNSLIGHPFPGIEVSLENSHLTVNTPYAASGLKMPYDSGDLAHQDQLGRFCFDGRTDNLCKVNGVTISLHKITTALQELPGVLEAAVTVKHNRQREYLSAYLTVTGSGPHDYRRLLLKQLKTHELPRQIHIVEQLPKNESGKIITRNL